MLTKNRVQILLTFLAVAVAHAVLSVHANVIQLENNKNYIPQSVPYDCGKYFSMDNASELLDKNGIVPQHFRWPKGVVPYTLQPDITDKDREVLKAAIEMISGKTCLKYVERTTEMNYATIVTVGGSASCYANGVGMRGGPQLLNLGPLCMHAVIVAHELLHVTGFWHEHARADRDEYITVDFSNIKEDKHDQFTLCTTEKDECSSFDTPYNVMSIMHYPGMGASFAKDQTKPIMIAKTEKGVPKIPDLQLEYPGLTQDDINRIHRMYNNCQ